jgi:hypothetical protein
MDGFATMDDETYQGTVDAFGPWTIKSISKEARDLANALARQESMTVGNWLDRLIRGQVDGGEAPAGPGVPALIPRPAARASGGLDHVERVVRIAIEAAGGNPKSRVAGKARRLAEKLVETQMQALSDQSRHEANR